jgi:putative ABC transport system substrate-binding protein
MSKPDLQTSLAAFVQALEELGWAEGRNVRIETRWAGGDARQIRGYAAELAALAPDVILVHGIAAMGPCWRRPHHSDCVLRCL